MRSTPSVKSPRTQPVISDVHSAPTRHRDVADIKKKHENERNSVFTPIHEALGLEPGELSIDLINTAIDAELQESDCLDWKRDLYSHKSTGEKKPGKPWQDEAAKDIAAMANSGGGWIFFGVQEEEKTGKAQEIHPIDWDSSEEQKLYQTAWNRIQPPVMGIDFFPIADNDGKVVLAMRVPGSTRTPHFAMNDSGFFRVPIRNGSHTTYLDEHEIEKAYQQRFRHIDDEEKRLKTLFDHAATSLGPDCGLRFVAAAIPIERNRLPHPLAENEVSQLLMTLRPAPQLSNPKESQREPSWTDGTIRRGLRRWVIRTSEIHQSRHFLHDDRSIAYCRHIDMPEGKRHVAGNQPKLVKNHCRAWEIETCVIDFITLLRGYAQKQHVEGGYQIQIGLVTDGKETIHIHAMDPSTLGAVLPENASEAIFWFEDLTLEFDPLVAVDSLSHFVFEFATDILNQAGIQSTNVIPAPAAHLSQQSIY